MDVPPLKFSARTQLVSVSVVRALSGMSADAIQALVDSGKLRFVFNLSARFPNSKVCEWRFWIQEIVAPASVSRLTSREAIVTMIGEHRQRFRGAEIAQLLLVSRPAIHRLHQARALPGQIKSGTLWVERPALEAFLAERISS